MKGSTVCALHNPGWEEEPAVQSDWGDQSLHSPSHWEFRGGGKSAVWGILKGFPEEGMELAGRI